MVKKSKEGKSINLRILPMHLRAFLAGTAHQGHEKNKAKSMIASLCQGDSLRTRLMMNEKSIQLPRIDQHITI